MGRSAKLHKRTPKKTTSSGPSSNLASTTITSSKSHVQAAKKKAGLKEKTPKPKGISAGKGSDGILGGADYVSLMMGSRRKAREEAGKLPRQEN